LTEQANKVTHTVDLLVEYMEHNDPMIADELKQNVHEADLIKVRNLHELNDAFSTPIDREDIYRAIIALDDIVMYCKTTVHEMDVLDVKPDEFMRDISHCIKEGVDTLAKGFAKLGTTPAEAALNANQARQSERHAEKLYRKALPILFDGTDYINMFKRREIYRHLTNRGQDQLKARCVRPTPSTASYKNTSPSPVRCSCKRAPTMDRPCT
ncbi:MAG: hypothetical protein FD121_1712, partial [Gallionellaceae bacterium]